MLAPFAPFAFAPMSPTPSESVLQQAADAASRLGAIGQRLVFERERSERIAQKLVLLEQQKALLVKAVGLIDRAIEEISRSGVGTIEEIVTGGIQLAFRDPSLGFHVVKQEGKRGNTYSLEGQRGEVTGNLLDTFGHGLANVVALLLRVIMIERFKLARVLILDEQFNNVYAGYLPMLSRLLQSLTRDHGFTIVAVTHQKMLAMAADNVYRVVPYDHQAPALVKVPLEAMANWEQDLWTMLEDFRPQE